MRPVVGHSRSRARRAVRSLLLLPLLLVLAGCFRLDMGVTVNEDDTLDVAMEFGDVAGIASREDMDCSQMESEIIGNEPEGVTFEVADIEDDEGNVGCRIEATGAPLDTLADDGGMSVAKVDDTYVFTFEGDPAGMGDMSDFEDMPGGMEPQVTISVTFPGEVISGDGAIDGNTVTWTGLEAFATGGTATGEASGSALGAGSTTVVWIVLGVVALLAIAALVYFLVKRSKSTDAGTTAGRGNPGGTAAHGGAPAPYGAPGGGAYSRPGQPEGGFGPADQVPADPGPGYPGQQPPAAPSAFTTAVADTPVDRPEGESFAPPEPAEPQPATPEPEGAPSPDPQAGPGQPGEDQPGEDQHRGDQPR